MIFQTPKKLSLAQAALLPIALPVLALFALCFVPGMVARAVRNRRRLGFWSVV